MTSSIKKLKNSEAELTVDLGKEDLLFYADQVERKLTQEIEVEGFRAGKAPKNFIRHKIGEDKIREEALNLAIQTSLTSIFSEQKLDVFDQSNFKILENSKDKLVYQVTLLLFPEINLGDYKNWEIKKEALEVSESEIDNFLSGLLKSRAVLKEVNQPAKKGDRVEVDFIVKDKEGAVIEGGKSENHPVILGEGGFLVGFEEQIIGMKSGESKKFSLQVPDDYYQKPIAGKDLDFEVMVKKVEERTIPKLDDQVIKSLGEFKNTDSLRAGIKKNLLAEKEKNEETRIRQELLARTALKTEVEIPEIFIQKQLDSMIGEFDASLHQKGMELGLYLAHLNKTETDLRKEWLTQAKARIKANLIIRAIAKEEKLKINEQEVNKEFQAVLQQYLISQQGKSGQEILENVDPAGLRNRIRSLMLEEKVFEFLEKNNKISVS